MSESKTTKVPCPVCKSNNCFKTVTDDISSYLCMRCGNTTNSYFTVGSPQLEEALEKSPEIIKDLKQVDPDTNLVWIPSVINIPSKGMIYPMGHKEKWYWVFSPIVKLSKEERKKYPIPGTKDEYYEQRLGVETVDGMKRFGKLQYLEACKEMGITKDIEEQIE